MLPSVKLLSAVVICLASALLCTTLVRQPPWLGLAFEQTTTGATLRLVSVDASYAGKGPQSGDSLIAIGAVGGMPMAVKPRDLLEEPDFLDTWAEEDAFYVRQSLLTEILRAPQVSLTLHDKSNTVRTVIVTPRHRPLNSLPLIFWLQLLFGAAGMIIGAWVWALRPADWGPRAYAITGACFLIFAHAAAIYSARELALPGTLFRTLSGINHFGAIHFGAALCALFLVYPIRLTGDRVPLYLGAIASLWWQIGRAHV